ncbi:MAG: hypothetical protein H0U40_05335 [Chloroflexia bacterium]|nr:hypothetical protein [Chloroflexia bacterium]
MIRYTALIAIGLAFVSAWVHLVLAPYFLPGWLGGPVESLEVLDWLGGPIAQIEALHDWAVAAFLGAAVALASLGVGRLCSSGQGALAALGAALLFAVATAGLGYASVAAISSGLDLLAERSGTPEDELLIAGGLIIASVVALTGTILAGLLTVNRTVTFVVRRSAATRSTSVIET